ncbi:MAG TPA: acetyl-CoA carboxylase biotin carboxyl carrier protein [Terriglobia bacterium]|jgi:acetyl-CoA carboxylase biotin carboxyl carrier protein|nr:acetyl-CoA carboxylase biotin carboxyl carrier protein [Terriglobia bacterium]
MPSKHQPRSSESEERSWGVKDLQRLIDVLIEREISEFEMEKDGFRIRIKRGNTPATVVAAAPAAAVQAIPAPAIPPAVLASPPEPAPSPGAAPAEPAEPAEGLHIIKSPIVGTFYASPSPDAPPFVKPGDVVEVGKVLCIIEAMKLMNEIESEVAGEVVRVYVENGQPVEYGQSLFAIKPSHKKQG